MTAIHRGHEVLSGLINLVLHHHLVLTNYLGRAFIPLEGVKEIRKVLREICKNLGSNPSSHPVIAIGQCKAQALKTFDNTKEFKANPPCFSPDPRIARSSNKMLAHSVPIFSLKSARNRVSQPY